MADTLKELMEPKRMELQYKFENARHAVIESYRLAEKKSYLDDIVTTDVEGKKVYTSRSSEDQINEMVRVARQMQPEIEKDLNATLRVLEVKDGDKAHSS